MRCTDRSATRVDQGVVALLERQVGGGRGRRCRASSEASRLRRSISAIAIWTSPAASANSVAT